MTALLIAGRSKANAAHGSMVHVVAMLFVRLYIRTELDDGMFGGVELLSGHDKTR